MHSNRPTRAKLGFVQHRRVIVHVDLDAFYASVEIHDNPALRGLPVVVGGHAQRGVVTAASYEARKYGVRSAMPMSWALRACPSLVVVRPRMQRYAEVSDQFFEVLSHYSPLVQGLSLDEAFLDLTGTQALLGTPLEAVSRLRKEVRDVTGLACSAGIAPVKFAAKIVTDLAKPDGQIEVLAENLVALLDPLAVGRLFGVGAKTEAVLKSAGIRTIGQLRLADPEHLRFRLGNDFSHLQTLARGEDPREVESDLEAKSVGAEETFDRDVEDLETIETYLLGQAERVAGRLRRSGVVASGVTLKYKYEDFKLVTRQSTVEPTNDGTALYLAARQLLHAHRPQRPIRLCGVSAHGIGPPPAPELFAKPNDKRDRLNAALDSVREKFGRDAITRARLLTLDNDDAEALKPPRSNEPGRK
jgi:DNA polymerase-4